MAMLLAAESAGLGALFFGQFEHERDVAEMLGVPGGQRALGTVALGRRGDGPSVSESVRRLPRPDPQERIHSACWSPLVAD